MEVSQLDVNKRENKEKGRFLRFHPDIKEERLQLLARHSLCASVHVQESFTNESIKHVTDALGGPADVTIECSGSPSAVRLAIHVSHQLHLIKRATRA